MARPNPLAGSFVVLGSRVPRVVGLLIGLTLGASIIGAVGYRNGLETVVQSAALVPALVFRGQGWRLLSWIFFEIDPLGLVFACLALFWFGRDLTQAWGPVRFLTTYLLLAGLTGVLVLPDGPSLAVAAHGLPPPRTVGPGQRAHHCLGPASPAPGHPRVLRTCPSVAAT